MTPKHTAGNGTKKSVEDSDKSGEFLRVTVRFRKETADYLAEKQRELLLPSAQRTIHELIKRAEFSDELKKVYEHTFSVMAVTLEKRISIVEEKAATHAWEARKIKALEIETESNRTDLNHLRSELTGLKLQIAAEMEERILLTREAAESRLGRSCSRRRKSCRPVKRTTFYPISSETVQAKPAVADDNAVSYSAEEYDDE